MIRILVLYHPSCESIESLAYNIAAGARSVGAAVDIRKISEAASGCAAKRSISAADDLTPEVAIADLSIYDAIIIGVGTQFGRISPEMADFLVDINELGTRGMLRGKVGSTFGSSNAQYGSLELTLFTIISNFLRFEMIVVGSPHVHWEVNRDVQLDTDNDKTNQIDLSEAHHRGEIVATTAIRFSK